MATFISLEDHFMSTAAKARSKNLDDFGFHLWPNELLAQLSSLDDIRIDAMDRGEVALQVVSSVPGAETPDVCQDTNDLLADAIKCSKGRLAGFAALPMDDPTAAAAELKRATETLGFVGALIPNHAHGRYYDSQEYRVFWRQVAALNRPVYIHPCPLSDLLKSIYKGNYPDEIATILSVGGWGWHADTAVHFIKLYCSGVFDEFPTLKIIIGHAGEMLPYMLNRVNSRLTRGWGARERDLKTVWQENLWITISGIWDLAPFSCLIKSIPMERIMFSVDWPFEKNESGRDFMETVRDSGLLSREEWEMVAWKNAEQLLGIKWPN